MKLIANNTIQGVKVVALASGLEVQEGTNVASPGDEFEASDTEAKRLIGLGAARQKTRTVADDGAPSDGLEKLNKAELLALAKDRDVTVPADATNAQIVTALRAAAPGQ